MGDGIIMKKTKLNSDKMMMDNLSFMERFGIKSIQIGNTSFKKAGKSTLEITTKRKIRNEK